MTHVSSSSYAISQHAAHTHDSFLYSLTMQPLIQRMMTLYLTRFKRISSSHVIQAPDKALFNHRITALWVRIE
jgi:hypothetical protein